MLSLLLCRSGTKPVVTAPRAATASAAAAQLRAPRQAELKVALDYLEATLSDANGNLVPKATAHRQKLEDLLWALMNTKEFLFNH